MAIEVVITCPLGSACEEIKNNKLYRCRWYTQVAGINPQTGESVDEWNCAMSWIPLLLIENANTNRGQTAAIESMRNEQVNGQTTFNGLMQEAINQQSKINQIPKLNNEN